MPLTIVAQFKARDGQADALLEALRALIPVTRGETGCQAYDLHRSLTEPDLFHFHEVWSDRASWQAHMGAPHLQAFAARQDDLVAEWRLFELERVA